MSSQDTDNALNVLYGEIAELRLSKWEHDKLFRDYASILQLIRLERQVYDEKVKKVNTNIDNPKKDNKKED